MREMQRFLLTPLREGRRPWRRAERRKRAYFYSRPCGRGDVHQYPDYAMADEFLLTPLREGRRNSAEETEGKAYFYSRPCGRGDSNQGVIRGTIDDFYSRPCGRGD